MRRSQAKVKRDRWEPKARSRVLSGNGLSAVCEGLGRFQSMVPSTNGGLRPVDSRRRKIRLRFRPQEINTYCYVVHQSMYSTERNRAVYQQCVQDYNPELTAQIHRVAWATCFSQDDWTGQYPKGTRAAYDECMRQKDIYSSFCNQKKTVVDAFYAREHPNVRSTPSPPCGGPMPNGREIQVLRMLANNMQITPATTMTSVADGSASNAGGQPREVIVPIGVMMSIRSIDQIDVAGVRSTNRFRARLEGDPVKSNGREVIPVGTELLLKATVKANGWVNLSVDYAKVNGMRLPLATNEVMRAVPGIQKEEKEGSKIAAAISTRTHAKSWLPNRR
jgi:hypothetical protein